MPLWGRSDSVMLVSSSIKTHILIIIVFDLCFPNSVMKSLIWFITADKHVQDKHVRSTVLFWALFHARHDFADTGLSTKVHLLLETFPPVTGNLSVRN